MADPEQVEEHEQPESRQRRGDTDQFMLRRAQRISEKWGKRLDDFELPCPLCKGELQFQGVYYDHLYEFAEGEPGVINEMDVLPISFVCSHCGYTAEFDADLFNPAFLAQLQGAPPQRVQELTVRDFTVLIPLTGKEENNTLLDLATAVAEAQNGRAVVFNATHNEGDDLHLRHKLEQYQPQAGAPAPIYMARNHVISPAEALAKVAERERCDLLLITAHGLDQTGGDSQTAVIDIIKPVLNKSLCDVAIVHNRGQGPEVKRILLATAGGPNAKIAAQLAVNLASAFNAEIEFLNVASPNNPDARADGQARIAETLHDVLIADNVRFRTRVVVSSEPVQAIVQEASGFDLLLIGDSPRSWRGKVPLNSISAKTARNCTATAIIVLGRHNQIQSWIDRLFG